MVFCYQKCSDLLWEKIVLVIEKKFWNSSLKAENLQIFWDQVQGQNAFLICSLRFLRSNKLEPLEFKLKKTTGIYLETWKLKKNIWYAEIKFLIAMTEISYGFDKFSNWAVYLHLKRTSVWFFMHLLLPNQFIFVTSLVVWLSNHDSSQYWGQNLLKFVFIRPFFG